MAKFSVFMESVETLTVEVEAATPHEAFARARATAPERPWKLQNAEGDDGSLFDFAGRCESCGGVLLYNESAEQVGPAWQTDEEGVQWHLACPKPTPKAEG